MDCTLLYGQDGLRVDLPGHWDVTIIAKKHQPVLNDPAVGVQAAFAAPVAARSLEEEAAGCRTACILVCDVTRPVPNGLVLRPIVERLLGAGVQPAAITILVATGLHRPNEGQELARLIGDPWVAARVSIANHVARNDEEHSFLGTTSQGMPVRIDRRFLDADLRVAVGLVEPHFMAGWSGGRKLILPGIAHAETIAAFHAYRMICHPRSATCVLSGNPEHEAQLEVLRMSGRTLAVNLVIDEARRLSFASYGGIVESHAAAVAFADPFFRVTVPRRFRTVLASSAGYPLDATYYQAVKGIYGGAAILEPGGDLFVAAACTEGLGSTDFRRSQEKLLLLGRERFRAQASTRALSDVDEWETLMLLKALDAGSVHLYTDGLSGEERGLTGVAMTTDLTAELRTCVERDPEHRLAVIPEGPYVAPEHRGRFA